MREHHLPWSKEEETRYKYCNYKTLYCHGYIDNNTHCNVMCSIVTSLAPRGRKTRTKKDKKLPSPSPSNPELLGDLVLPSPGTHSEAMLASFQNLKRGKLGSSCNVW